MKQLLMYWYPDTPIAKYDLPEGYSFSNYSKESDKKDWCIICQNGLLGNNINYEKTFDNYMKNENIKIERDVFFLDYKGEHVATITSFVHFDHPDCMGEIHMVSIRTDFRGKGLSKYLTQKGLEHLVEFPEMKYAHLTSDDWRRPAVKGYLEVGFLPVNYDDDMVERWQVIIDDPKMGVGDEIQILKEDATKDFVMKKSKVRGKIFALGGGFTGEAMWDLAKKLINFTGKLHPNFLHIPTTQYDLTREFAYVDAFVKAGCTMAETLNASFVGLTEEAIAKAIRNADIIYVPGGNLRFAMDTWNRTNIAKYLKEAFDDGKILFGVSSGSMCWFKQGYDDCGYKHSLKIVDGLGIIPYANVPHYETSYWQNFNDDVKYYDESAIALENDTALAYIDGKYSILLSGARPDAKVWFFDKAQDFKRIDLMEHPEVLKNL